MEIIYNNKIFRSYDEYYYVSSDGEVYSTYKKGLLKHYIDINGYHRVDLHGKHIKIHRLVYNIWCGNIPQGMQVNHYDDNKDNNCYKNLYIGTQHENIHDCFRNNHRCGNIKTVTVLDKETDKIITFPSIKHLIEYTGHSVSNNSLSGCVNKKWFNKRFDIIERKSVETIESYNIISQNYNIKNKTTMYEASRVV